MGCSGSKAEDLPLVVRCRERRELIRAAANHRYALAAAHVSYFRSLKDVGDALRKFVDEELITISASSSSSLSSPSLILQPASKVKIKNADKSLHLYDDEDDSHLHLSDSSTDNDGDSEGDYKHQHHEHHSHDSDDGRHQHHSHRAHEHKGKGFDDGVENFHNVEESSSRYPGGGFYGYGYGHGFEDGLMNDLSMSPSYPLPPLSYGDPYTGQRDLQGMRQPLQLWHYSNNSNVNYMKNSAPAMKTVVQDPPAQPAYGYSNSYWNSPAGYGGDYRYFPMGPAVRMRNSEGVKVSPQKEAPPPPSPKASAWDFFNPFDVFDGGYADYSSSGKYGYGSNSSSPDSSEVREREGIPDLEEETENEVYKEALKGKRMNGEAKKSSGESTPGSRAVPVKSIETSSRSVPLRRSEGSSRSVPLHKSESSSRSVPSWSSEESEKPSMPLQYSGESVKTSMPPQYCEEIAKPSMSQLHSKGKSWADQSPNGDMAGSINLIDESPETLVSKSLDEGSVKKKGEASEVEWTSKQDLDSSRSSSVTMLPPHGIRDLREVMAEIRDDFEIASSYGKEVAMMLEVGKLPYRPGFLKVILSRMLYLIAPSLTFRDSSSMQSVKLASRSMKLAKSYFEDVGKDVNAKVCNLSSTLDKLYAWEKKLYKEDEERLRVMYEKQCKRLKILDEEGAESSKIYAAQASTRRLLTKLDVSIKAIDVISSRIHKLRDEELQPKVAALIHGLIRMWKAMLKCHQKQFQAIMESKMRKLKVNTGLQADSSSRATTGLEKELHAWCHHFNDWIGFQKSYVESLNGWLLQCLQYEPEDTPDGPVPYSPASLELLPFL
ncbi:hypothetical protein Pfo_017233 [Paulownia fortunei]|nr:hypothetical protein Pfo_017233 [Paulownia fortunei]